MATLDRPVRVGLLHPVRTWLQALGVVLADLPDIEVVAAHPELRWVRHAAAQGDVDVVVMRVPSEAGPAEVQAIREAGPGVGIVVIGDGDDPAFIAALVRAGARGYLAENGTLDDLHSAIRAVSVGHTWLTPAHLTLLVEGLLAAPPARQEEDDRLAVLSEREREILDCLAQGMRREEIASRLYISPNTVRTHINHLIKKLNVHSALAAVSITTGSNGSLPHHQEKQRRVPEARRDSDAAPPINRRPGE